MKKKEEGQEPYNPEKAKRELPIVNNWIDENRYVMNHCYELLESESKKKGETVNYDEFFYSVENELDVKIPEKVRMLIWIRFMSGAYIDELLEEQ